MIPFSHATVQEFLETKPGRRPAPEHEDPRAETRRLDLTVLMSCCIVLRHHDERPRRLEESLEERFESLRQAIGKVDGVSCGARALGLLAELSSLGYLKERWKLCPLPPLVLKSLVLSLADSGLLGFPEDWATKEGDKEAIANRKAMELMASELTLRFGKAEKREN